MSAYRTYIIVCTLLLVLTGVTVGVSYLHLGMMNVAAALLIASLKAALVALYFMHLKFERRTLALVALSPFVLCVFLILMLTPDIFPH